MMASNSPGVVWTLTLCFVVVITHVHLRGLWSVIAILVLGFTTVLLAVLGLWDPILRAVRVIDIHINGFDYLSISLFLLVVWLLTYTCSTTGSVTWSSPAANSGCGRQSAVE